MEGIGERHALHVGRGRAEGRVGNGRGKGISVATTGDEVEGYRGRREVGGVGLMALEMMQGLLGVMKSLTEEFQ